jgi:hypothetical protein
MPGETSQNVEHHDGLNTLLDSLLREASRRGQGYRPAAARGSGTG